MRLSRWNCWKTNPIVSERSAATSSSVIFAVSWPAMRSTPVSGRSSRPIMCSSVDLPEPDAPMSDTNSPSLISIDTPRNARTVVSPI